MHKKFNRDILTKLINDFTNNENIEIKIVFGIVIRLVTV